MVAKAGGFLVLPMAEREARHHMAIVKAIDSR